MSALRTLIMMMITTLVPALCFSHPFVLQSRLSHGQLWSDGHTKTYLKVTLRGEETNGQRTPVNLALVIDRSGSMSGQRIQQAKEAARTAIRLLKPDDIISLIAYDSSAEVLVPASRVGDGRLLLDAIERLKPRGSTALFAGTTLGAQEVKKFLKAENVNRVLLLSDGIANIGPSSPTELAQLGMELAREGISVSTIGLGLGYNEDLMTKLAASSDGNHAFVEHPERLATIMTYELNDATSVVARDVHIEINLPRGARPIRSLGRAATIDGQRVTSRIKDLISQVDRYVLIEVELDEEIAQKSFKIADIEITYHDQKGREEHVSDRLFTRVARSAEEMDRSAYPDIMENVVSFLAHEQQERAIELKDQGEDERAAEVMEETASYLREQAERLDSEKLREMEERRRRDTAIIKKKGASREWGRSRKALRQEAYSDQAQMAY